MAKRVLTLAVLVGLVIGLLSGCGGEGDLAPTPSPTKLPGAATSLDVPDGMGQLATLCDNGHRIYIFNGDEMTIIKDDPNCARLNAEKALDDALKIK